jgi:hypothetical protein
VPQLAGQLAGLLEVGYSEMQEISILTLIDITDTGCFNQKLSNNREYHQRQNLHVMLQCISLRCQPLNYSVSLELLADVSKYNFAIKQKKAPLWKLSFFYDRPDVWKEEDDMIYWLRHDFDNVPVTPDLGVTKNVFSTISMFGDINTIIVHS